MYKSFTMIMLVLLSSVCSTSLFAEDSAIKLCSVQIGDNGRAYISPCNGWPSKNSCPSNNWLTWDANTGWGKLMYGTALAA